MNLKTIITRNIFILSLVSLFADVASEMLYPVMPIYLKHIGFSIVLIGVLEGFAEAIAGLSKGYFGKRSDLSGKRLPFVQIGYALSAVSKPMIAMFVYPLWVFLARSLDRVGKGVRTGARDALLSDEATPQTKGRVFGFHRALDTFGAVIGPSLALVYLLYRPNDYTTLFYLAFVPGLMAIAFTFLIKEQRRKPTQTDTRHTLNIFAFIGYWRESPTAYRRLVAGLLLFTLVNSSDVFLLLKIKEAGLSDTAVIGVYIFYNLVYALFAYPFGGLADKLGMKTVLVIGLVLFAVVYFGMAFAHTWTAFVVLFLLYGIYAAATEGVSKAWISNICAKSQTATAIGTFTAFQSIAALLASSLAGWIWYAWGASAVFLLSGLVSMSVALYVSRLKYEKISQF